MDDYEDIDSYLEDFKETHEKSEFDQLKDEDYQRRYKEWKSD